MPDEPAELRWQPRASEDVTLRIPSDTLDALREVAERRDMSVEALMKLYVGTSLHRDLERAFETPSPDP
ncbi:MAG: hypothetical protein AB1941_26705 [Gemmatimonadota bacterium]